MKRDHLVVSRVVPEKLSCQTTLKPEIVSAAAASVVGVSVLRKKAVAARRDLEGYIVVVYLRRLKEKYVQVSKNI